MFHFITFTLPGVPFLYYGDEIGMRYQEGVPSKECGFSRTGTRTVMNWDDSKNNGFSTAEEIWLPIDESTNVKAMQEKEDPLWWLVKNLIALRKGEEDLQGNEIEVVSLRKKRILCYRRGGLIIAVNPSAKEEKIEFPRSKIVFCDGTAQMVENGFILGAQTAVIFKK